MLNISDNPNFTYIHGITTSRLLTGMAFSESPEEGVGQGVFTEVGKNFVIDLEGGEIGCCSR